MLKNYMESVFTAETDWVYITSTSPISEAESCLLFETLRTLIAQFGADANYMVYIGKPVLMTGEPLDTETENGIYIIPKDKFPLVPKSEINIVSKQIYAQIVDIVSQETQVNVYDTESQVEQLFDDKLIIGLVEG